MYIYLVGGICFGVFLIKLLSKISYQTKFVQSDLYKYGTEDQSQNQPKPPQNDSKENEGSNIQNNSKQSQPGIINEIELQEKIDNIMNFIAIGKNEEYQKSYDLLSSKEKKLFHIYVKTNIKLTNSEQKNMNEHKSTSNKKSIFPGLFISLVELVILGGLGYFAYTQVKKEYK